MKTVVINKHNSKLTNLSIEMPNYPYSIIYRAIVSNTHKIKKRTIYYKKQINKKGEKL